MKRKKSYMEKALHRKKLYNTQELYTGNATYNKELHLRRGSIELKRSYAWKGVPHGEE